MDIGQWEFAYVPTTGVRREHVTPVVVATEASREGYGQHGAVVPLDDEAEFLDRQGRVHARVSVDFVKEFGCYLAAPMRRPGGSRA